MPYLLNYFLPVLQRSFIFPELAIINLPFIIEHLKNRIIQNCFVHKKCLKKKPKKIYLWGLYRREISNFRKGFAIMADQKDKDTDIKKIKELVEMMVANDLVEMEIIDGDNKILLKRPQPQQAAVAPVQMIASAMPPAYTMPVAQAPATPQAAAPEAQDNLVDIKSPIVGTFYAAPSPDSAPYVKVGDDVNAETLVCIIEAMKVMNEIKAETAGTVAKIMVANGQAVEYGQVLFKVKPH
jgi:acetyl-CoA carboxylase biotin carboxyl carrier protein